MSKSIDELLEQFCRNLFPEREDEYISHVVDECKKAMGKSIASRFSSYFDKDEEILYIDSCYDIWNDNGLLFPLTDYQKALEWFICMTNQKIVAFSKGLFGSCFVNYAVKVYPLDIINSVDFDSEKVIITTNRSRTTYLQNTSRKSSVASFYKILNQRLNLQAETQVKSPETTYAIHLDFVFGDDIIHEENKAASTSSESSDSVNNTLEQLERLSQLYQQGILTEEEFQTQKQKILNNK